MCVCVWVYMDIAVFSVYMRYKKKTGAAVLFLDCTLILICTSYSVATNFRLPHNSFSRCTHQCCLFSVIQRSLFVLAVTLLCSFLPGAALWLVMALSCFPEALCFSCCSMCYSMVLMPTSHARGLQCFFPGELFTAMLCGCLALGREQGLEKRQRSPGGHTALSLCPSLILSLSSLLPVAAPHHLPTAASSVKAAAFSLAGVRSCLCQPDGRCLCACLRRHTGRAKLNLR